MPNHHEPRMIAALLGRNAGRPPVWMMRQAGRALQSYRTLRQGTDFLSFCKDIDKASEATLIPVRELEVDAAILFADILLPLEALGLNLRFDEGVGPVVTPAIGDGTAAARLRAGDVTQTTAYVGEIVRRVRAALPAEVALIGFAPGPWTIAAYMIEGHGRRGFPTLKRFLYTDPQGLAALLDLLTDVLVDYGRMQIAAGAQAFQVFDTWAELLPPAVFRSLVAPRLRRQLEAYAAVPRIYFPKGTAAFVDAVAELPCEAIGCDWTVELSAMRRALPARALQGNLDPTLLLADAATVAAATRSMLDGMRGDRAYVANLGHGLLPETPETSVQAFAHAVRSWEP